MPDVPPAKNQRHNQTRRRSCFVLSILFGMDDYGERTHGISYQGPTAVGRGETVCQWENGP